jgi:hypothetical protein
LVLNLKKIALKLKTNSKLLFTLIRIQARFKGLLIRKKVKSIKINNYNINNDPNSKFAKTSNEKIVKIFKFMCLFKFLNKINFDLKFQD